SPPLAVSAESALAPRPIRARAGPRTVDHRNTDKSRSDDLLASLRPLFRRPRGERRLQRVGIASHAEPAPGCRLSSASHEPCFLHKRSLDVIDLADELQGGLEPRDEATHILECPSPLYRVQ